jgi:hypothetical protein
MRKAALLALLVLVAGCASVHQTTGGMAPGQQPALHGKVVIVPLADGRERGGEVAAGSGSAVTAALRDSLLIRGMSPFVSDHRSFEEGLAQAKALGYQYVLKGEIIEWEDNATEWSGKPDSAGLSIEVYDLTPTLVASGTHRVRSSSMAMTSKTPDRFIPELTKAVLDRAFALSAPAR